MITIYQLKPQFQKLLRPCTVWLARRSITANQVTLAALLLSLLVGGVLAIQPSQLSVWLILPAVLFLRMALNAIDGLLAREHGMKTPLGAILNEMADVVSDAALYLPFALLPTVTASLVVLLVILAVLTEMMGVVAVQIGASRRYDGPLGKSDRAFVFGSLAVVLGAGWIVPGGWLNGLFIIMLILSIWTVINRARQALLELAK